MAYDFSRSEGMVIAARTQGEADMVYVIYSRDYGAISVFAKGIRYEKSKIRGHLELFTHVRFAFVTGKERYRLTYATSVEVFHGIWNDLARFRAASRITNLVKELITGAEPDEHVWLLLKDAMYALNAEGYVPGQAVAFWYTFQLKLFSLLGYMPEAKPRIADAILQFPKPFPPILFSQLERAELTDFLKSIHAYALPRSSSKNSFFLT